MIDEAETPESAIPPQAVTPSSPIIQSPGNQSESTQPENPPLSDTPEQPETPTTTQESTETKETLFDNQLLINFLEKQKYPILEDQSLTTDQRQRQQGFNEKVDALIKSLTQKSEASITSDTFIQALNFGYQRNLPEQIEKIDSLINQAEKELGSPEDQDAINLKPKIDQLRQIKQELEEKLETQAGIPEEVKDHIMAHFANIVADKELKQKLITSLDNGDFDQIVEIFLNYSLQEKATDNKDSKQTKKFAKKVVESVKKYAPTVGSALGIILLLMILRSSQQGNSGGSPLG